MSELVENLKAARALIDTPEKWGKGWALTEDRNCAATACNGFKNPQGMFEALGSSLPEPGGLGQIFAFNDHPETTHQDIMDLYARAIAAAERSIAA